MVGACDSAGGGPKGSSLNKGLETGCTLAGQRSVHSKAARHVQAAAAGPATSLQSHSTSSSCRWPCHITSISPHQVLYIKYSTSSSLHEVHQSRYRRTMSSACWPAAMRSASAATRLAGCDFLPAAAAAAAARSIATGLGCGRAWHGWAGQGAVQASPRWPRL